MSGEQEEPDGLYPPDETGITWIEDPNGPPVILIEDEAVMYFGDPKTPEFEELLRQHRVSMLDRVREIIRQCRHD